MDVDFVGCPIGFEADYTIIVRFGYGSQVVNAENIEVEHMFHFLSQSYPGADNSHLFICQNNDSANDRKHTSSVPTEGVRCAYIKVSHRSIISEFPCITNTQSMHLSVRLSEGNHCDRLASEMNIAIDALCAGMDFRLSSIVPHKNLHTLSSTRI